MSGEVGKRVEASKRSARSGLSSVGRVAIWAVIALLLVRGVGAVLAPTQASAPTATRESADPASAALAVRFARAYLGDPTPRALAPFLAEGAQVGAGSPPTSLGAEVAQAEVAATDELGGGRAVLTVACDLRDGRSL